MKLNVPRRGASDSADPAQQKAPMVSYYVLLLVRSLIANLRPSSFELVALVGGWLSLSLAFSMCKV
jgi:hypothetical protein